MAGVAAGRVAREVFEPELGTPVGGWGARAQHDAKSRHQELTVTAHALSDEMGRPLVIVAGTSS